MRTRARWVGTVMVVGLLLAAGPCTADRDDGRLIKAAYELKPAAGADAEDLFAAAVRLVAEQRAVYSGDVVGILGEAVRDHIELLIRLRSPVPLCDAAGFIEAMLEAGAGGSVYAAALEHAQTELAGSPAGESLVSEALSIAEVVGLVTASDEAAGSTDDRGGVRDAFLNGMWRLVHVPASDLTGLVDSLAAGTVEPAATSTDDVWWRVMMGDLRWAMARHAYEVDQVWTSEEVIAIARGEAPDGTRDVDFFVDGTAGDSRAIKPSTEMTEDERAAYLAWLNSGAVTDRVTSDSDSAGRAMLDVINGVESCA